MSSQDIKLYLSENLSFKEKFIHLMNLLVINQSYFDFQNYLFYLIFSIQNISIFFTDSAGCLNPNESIFDYLLNKIGEIIRIKSLFYKHRNYYNLTIYLFSFYYIIFTVYYLILILTTTRKTVYTTSLQFLNFFIKVNIYVLANIILDFFTRMLCFNATYNRYIVEIKCNQSNNITPLFCSFFFNVYSTVLTLYIQLYYEENFFISDSKFNTITSKIYIYQHLSAIISSIALSLIHLLTHEFFYITNLIISCFLFNYYIKRLIYYNLKTNIIFGLSHFLYFHSSIFFSIFYFIDISYKGLIYILTSLIMSILFIIILNNLIIKIVKKTPFYKIKNKFFLLFYIKYIFDLTNLSIENQQKRALLKALIEMHSIECPNHSCLLKGHNKLYLPIINSWSDRNLPPEIDQIFLKNFIPILLKYFIKICYDTPELLMNLSYYYLKIIENYCMSLYYFYRVNESKLNLEENFLLKRLEIMIREKLYENFKEEGEICYDLTEMNPTLYFKYNDIAEKFIREIEKEIELNMEFWDFFSYIKANHKKLEFKKIFQLIEKIQYSKNKINEYWKNLFNINPGINTYFEIYLNYVTEVNDNNNLKNELETLKRKKEITGDHLINDYNELLFKNETAIVIVKGDKGKEGIIEKVNYEFGKIFKVNYKKIIGRKITEFMPKIFSYEHKNIMRKYFTIGEKKIINKGNYVIFGLDRYKRIIQLRKNLKLFPMINNNLFYIAALTLETIDDIIILNSNFIIQGMSQKLFDYFLIDNNELFLKNDIPFYLICKNFISFYRTFFKGKQKRNLYISSNQNLNEYNLNLNEYDILLKEEKSINEEKKKEENQTENKENDIIEINENMEIEYEIKFPDFLTKYSYYTKVVNLNETNYDDNDGINKEDSTFIQKQNFSFFTSPRKTIIMSGYASFKSDENKINYQLNGLRKILLYKTLFEQENFEELEKLFDKNTVENFISLKFHFSFEKKKFNDNYYYIIRCVDNEKFDKDDTISNIKNQHLMICDVFAYKNISSLFNLYYINNEEKETINNNISDFINLRNDYNFRRNYQKNISKIKTKSRVFGEKKLIHHNEIENENTSQNSNSSFNKNISKLHKIANIRNKNLENDTTSFIIINELKILPFILLFFILIFYIIYNSFFSKLKEELIFIRNYNSILYKFQITLFRILIRVIDYSVLFYSELYGYNITFNSEYSDKSLIIENLKTSVSKFYSESNSNIIFLERYIHKYVKETENKVWEQLKFNYSINVPFNDMDYFPIIAKNSLYDSYFLFQLDFFNNIDLYDYVMNDSIDLVDYATFMSINGVINIILPKLILSIEPLLENFLKFSNGLFFKFKLSIFFYLILNCILYSIMIFVTFNMIQHLNLGISKILRINQNDIQKIISNINNFRYNFQRKIQELNDLNLFGCNDGSESKLLKTFVEKTKLNTTNIKKFKEKSIISISNDFYFEKKKIKKMSFPLFSILFYIILLFFLIFFSILLFYVPKTLINDNSDLLISHTFLLKQFVFVSAKIFQMKSLFANYNDIVHLNLNKFENESLSETFYETLPKFKELYKFYYDIFLLDTCKAIYENDSNDYYLCKNNKKIILTNNTNSLKEYLLFKMEVLIYNYEILMLKNNTFNSYYMFNTYDYNEIMDLYTFYLPIYDRFHNILEKAFEKRSKDIQLFFNILFYIMIFLIIGNIFYQFLIYIPFFQKMLFISVDFIKIIPCNIILNTPDLENWLEMNENTL